MDWDFQLVAAYKFCESEQNVQKNEYVAVTTNLYAFLVAAAYSNVLKNSIQPTNY